MGLDAQVLILALRVSATIALVFGVLPVLQARGTDVQTLRALGSDLDSLTHQKIEI